MGEIVRDLSEIYLRVTGSKVAFELTRSQLVRDRILNDEPFDVAITTQSRLEELAAANKVFADA